MADPQTCDHATEAASKDNETLSDDEYFDCIQPEDGPGDLGPVPSAINRPADPPTPIEMDHGEVASPESRAPTPKPIETLPQTCGMYRLLNLVTERGAVGISE